MKRLKSRFMLTALQGHFTK